MTSYYIDAITNPRRPRLVRRMNNGDPLIFDNTLGTAVALDIENMQITYDIADGVTNPANVRMTDADLDGSGACVGECTRACPKGVDPAGAIQRYKLTAALQSLRSFVLPRGPR